MKIQGQKYKKMKAAYTAVVNHIGIEVINKNWLKVHSETKIIWAIWWQANTNLTCDDTHPTFIRQKRIHPYDASFDMYSDGDNDNHIDTALKKISRDLGVI
jgi:hypothetical protein